MNENWKKQILKNIDLETFDKKFEEIKKEFDNLLSDDGCLLILADRIGIMLDKEDDP